MRLCINLAFIRRSLFMVRRYITVEEQQLIIERAQQRCEYCQCPMAYSAQPYVFEHVIPVVRGGETSLDNLALACGGCNGYKYTKIEAFDVNIRQLSSGVQHKCKHSPISMSIPPIPSWARRPPSAR